MTSFVARLRQRKLVQWALAYIAAAFALIQALDVVGSSYHWPDRAMHALFGVLALGFVVVLVLAWYHGEKGAQKVSGPELLLIALALVIGGGLLWHFERPAPLPNNVAAAGGTNASHRNPGRAVPDSPAVAPASPLSKPPPVAIPAKSVAVLPFENLSTDKGNAYFAEGMQDLILTKLADIGDLKVSSRTSTAKYASHPDDLKTIGQQLGVATILEGSVQKAGNQVLINVQLIDARSDNHLWAQSYQRTLENIFGVEGEVAQKVADALNARLTAVESAAVAKVGTHDPAALDAFLKAGYYLKDANRTGDAAELARSVPLLRQAIAADPNYADAYTMLALAYEKLGGHDEEIEAAARRALALDPGNAGARTEYAFALINQGQFDKAVAEARKAVALPTKKRSNSENGLGVILAMAGRPDEAAKVFKHLVETDPRNNFAREWLAGLRGGRHRYREAREGFSYVVARDPGNVNAVSDLALVERLGWGDLASARKTLQSAAVPVASSATLSYAWYELDFAARDYPAALAVVAQAPAAMFDDAPRALYEARIYRAQGDSARARASFAAARSQLETKLKAAPGNRNLHVHLAQALAGSGDGNAAVAEAKRALALRGRGDRALQDTTVMANLAEVQAQTGHAGDAIRLLGRLLSMPAGMDVSVEELRLDPVWDPLRGDPRFQALLARHASAAREGAPNGAGQ